MRVQVSMARNTGATHSRAYMCGTVSVNSVKISRTPTQMIPRRGSTDMLVKARNHSIASSPRKPISPDNPPSVNSSRGKTWTGA